MFGVYRLGLGLWKNLWESGKRVGIRYGGICGKLYINIKRKESGWGLGIGR